MPALPFVHFYLENNTRDNSINYKDDMDINLLLQERKISKYKLTKLSDVPLTNINKKGRKKWTNR